MIRNQIIEELKRRLEVSKPLKSPTIIEGEGGVWGEWRRELPCIHIFELESTNDYSSRQRPGTYIKTLPIQIDYVSKLTRRDKIYSEGREKLEYLQAAIELDERFTENKSTSNEGLDLTIDFFMMADKITEVITNTLHVAVMYNFRFAYQHLGYEVKRH